MWGAPLARQIREGPPELVRRADVKKPETSSGFWNWWCRDGSTQTHSQGVWVIQRGCEAGFWVIDLFEIYRWALSEGEVLERPWPRKQRLRWQRGWARPGEFRWLSEVFQMPFKRLSVACHVACHDLTQNSFQSSFFFL